MIAATHPTRRRALSGLAAVFAAALPWPAHAEPVDALALGLKPGSASDQTSVLQKAISQAVRTRRPLLLPGGEYRVSDLLLPAGLMLQGSAMATLIAAADAPIARISAAADVTLEGLTFSSGGKGPQAGAGLLEIEDGAGIHIRQCRFVDSRAGGIVLRRSAARIDDCDLSGHADSAIFSTDSAGLIIRSNRIGQCGNGGILIWGSAAGHEDNSVVTGNAISGIDWKGRGNGQNGNGINVFHANGVILADNQIEDCAFSAIRLNAADNTEVHGNSCRRSGEVAIFSEFGFSGSLIANNVVDDAAGGISLTNFDQGGRLAVVSGNLVRNIKPRSEVNPDTTPFGIAAEADTAVSGNVVDSVPGVGISAGWGPYLRDVLVSDNLVRSCDVGIAVSVADKAGSAQVTGNMISGARRVAIVGAAWRDIVSQDLAADAGRFPNITLANNRVV